MKISIIVPVYNVLNMLEGCINSIINQTYGDFEILIVDDGSTDGSSVLCDTLAEKDSRIKVFHKSNGGLSDARNYGLEHAQGDFFLFIDSDDMLHRDFCKVLVESQKKYDADIVSTDIIEFYSQEDVNRLNSRDYSIHEFLFEEKEILQEYFKPQKKIIINHGLCMKLYKRTLFKDLRFEQGRLHEDLFITYLLLNKCKVFVYIDVPFYYYYQCNTNSITKNYGEKNFNDEVAAIIKIYNFFREDNELKDSLCHFIVYHGMFILEKSSCLTGSKLYKENKRKIRKLMINCVIKSNEFNFIKKFQLCMGCIFTKAYNMLKRVIKKQK